MDWDEFVKNYWSYYLNFEQDVLNTSRYVTFSEDNYSTYSVEYGKLLNSICAEIDNVFKYLCRDFDLAKRPSIKSYAEILIPKYPKLKEYKAKATLIKEPFQPFRDWDAQKASQTLVWWDEHAAFKHNRSVNEKKGNLRNVLLSLSALFLLETICLKELEDILVEPGEPREESKLFSTRDINLKWVFYGRLLLSTEQ
ncbi:hypothetical protein [Eubacterium maltosivorans]|uniref:hypothetical protein n=1 Tax=Eubacterium maltosivorans TaxID=2041044 RepID=UPI003A949BD6